MTRTDVFRHPHIKIMHPLVTALAVTILLGACSGQSPEQSLAKAKSYLAQSKAEEALIELKNVLQVQPDSAETRLLIGTILLDKNKPAEAEVELRRALAAGHPEAEVLPNLLKSMLASGQYKKLVDEFGTKRTDQPRVNAAVQMALFSAHSALKNPELAKKALDNASREAPDFELTLLAQARESLIAGDSAAAGARIERILQANPLSAEGWRFKAELSLQRPGGIAEALGHYRKSVEVQKSFLPGQLGIVTLLLQIGELSDAEKEIGKLEAIAPRSVSVSFMKAELALRQGNVANARQHSQTALRAAPDRVPFLQQAGAIELMSNSLVQAESHLSRAVRIAPEHLPARRLLISTYLRLGMPDKALGVLNGVLDKNGSYPDDMLTTAGEVLLLNGDAKGAEAQLSKAAKLNPQSGNARVGLALAQLAQGDNENALGILRDAAAGESGSTAAMALISTHIRRKEFDKALAVVDSLESRRPNTVEPALLRGRIHLAAGDKVKARAGFETALKRDAANMSATSSLAALDVGDRRFEDAKVRFAALTKLNPKNANAWLGMASVARSAGAEPADIGNYISKAVDADPTMPGPRQQLVEHHLRQRDFKAALAAAQSAIAALPNSPEALETLGVAQQAASEWNQAISSFGKLAAMQPNSPQPHLRKARAQLAAKDYQGAEQSLKKAIEIRPDMDSAHRELFLLMAQQKRYSDAKSIALTLQKRQPNAPIGYILEGDVSHFLGDPQAAAAIFKQGLRKVESTELAIKLHSAYAMTSNARDAEAFATNWLDAHKRDLKFRVYLGDRAVAAKDHAAAERHYQAALALAPNSPVILNNLAWTLTQAKKPGAVEAASKALALAPNALSFIDTLATAHMGNNRPDLAISVAKPALLRSPSDHQLRLTLAKAYIQAQDKTNARKELETLARAGDQFKAQKEVQALLVGL